MAKHGKDRNRAAKPLPRQKSLPGMANRRIAVLENAALKYADVRDERMHWTKRESEAKQRVKDLMHEQHIDHYVRANIEISLEPVVEDEKVIVRVRQATPTPVVDAQYPEVDEPPVKEPPDNGPRDEPEEEEDPDAVYDSKKDEPF